MLTIHTDKNVLYYDPHYTKLGYYTGNLFHVPFSEPIGLNEYKTMFNNKDLAHKSPYPNFIYLVLGHKCNFNCSYCMQKDFDRKDMPEDENIFLNKMRKYPYLLSEVRQLLFWGGEALVYWDKIKKIVTTLKKEQLVNSDIEFIISTNGSLLKKEMMSFINKNNIRISLSHDGFGQDLRSQDPLRENSESRECFLELARSKQLVLSPTLHIENFSRIKIYDYFDQIFKDTNIPINSFGLFYLNDDSLNFNPYLKFKEKAITLMLNEYYQGIAERSFDFNTTLGKFIYRLSCQNYDIRTTYESSFDISNIKKMRMNLNGELTCFHIGDFSKQYQMGNIDNIFDLKLSDGEFLTSSEKIRIRCTNCPVLPMCVGGEPYIQKHLSDYDCLSKFLFYIPTWLYLMDTYILKEPILKISNNTFRHKELLSKYLDSDDYKNIISKYHQD